jgi:hypothetical protein
MEPMVWGPPGWEFLHSITFQYPKEPTNFERKKYYAFFENLKYVLPCPTCQEHYTKNFDDIPIRLDNRQDLINWLIDIHNAVNIKNGKREWSYDEVYEKYNKMYNDFIPVDDDDKKESSFLSFNILLLILIIIIIVAFVYYRKNKGGKSFFPMN